MRAAQNLRKLFAPSVVAIVGATDREASLGEIVLRNSIASTGVSAIHPINPNRISLAERTCYPKVTDAPQAADVAFILLPADQCITAVRECGAAGIPFAIIGSSGFGEGGGDGLSLGQDLLEAAREAGVRLVGPNTNGTWNGIDDIHIGFNVSQGRRFKRGAIGLISQTGAMLGSTIAAIDQAGVGIAYAVSTGNELDLKLHDYLEFMLGSENVSAVGLAVDAIPDPRAFADAILRANTAQKPIVLLQMGTSKSGSAATELHASRVADPSGAVSYLMERLGVTVTADFDAYVAAMTIFGCGRQVPDHNEVLGLSSSGAGAALLADAGEAIDLSFVSLSAETSDRLSRLMKLTQPHNPLDITGESRDPNWVGSVLDAFAASNPAAPITYLITLMKEYPPDPRVHSYATLAEQQPDRLLMACVPAPLMQPYMQRLRESGVLVCSSLNAMFGGIRLVKLARQRARRGPDQAWLRDWLTRVDDLRSKGDRKQKTLVHDSAQKQLVEHGLRFPQETVTGLAGLQFASGDVGFPVALKLLSTERLHKASSGALALNLTSVDEILDAARAMNPGPEDLFLVQRMLPAGLNIFIGFERDVRYGGMLMVGAGGSDVERIRDLQTLLLPVSRDDILSALGRLRMADTLFSKSPSGPDWDMTGLIDAIASFASYAEKPGAERVVAAEINPLRVLGSGHGAWALDVRAVLDLPQQN